MFCERQIGTKTNEIHNNEIGEEIAEDEEEGEWEEADI